MQIFLNTHAHATHPHAYPLRIHVIFSPGFLIEVSIMTDNGFLVTGMNSIPFLFPLCLWPLTSLAMCGAPDGSGLWCYPSSLIEFIHSLSFVCVFESICFSSLTWGRQSVCVCLRNVSPAFTLSSAQHLNTHHTYLERKKWSVTLLLCVRRTAYLCDVSDLDSLLICKSTWSVLHIWIYLHMYNFSTWTFSLALERQFICIQKQKTSCSIYSIR